ncbi:focadhesin [Sabethes cyaneus]|uniref:focadhesin n=1 Tax=Sabethes cyaneus TaxID=53552 RepID=UPI00237EE12E|nr:focadhesin [Sabethes cyaneus]
MDDFKLINSKPTVLSTANSINKVLKSEKSNHGEIELLKSLLKADNPRTVQLAVQALLQLVRAGSLDLGQLLGVFIPALAGVSTANFTAIGSGIFELLLLDLRRRCSDPAASYTCQFDVRPPQHPFILLLNNREVSNMMFFTSKVQEICLHYDQIIRRNSVEFLRPVFLYVFNHPVIYPESQKIWRALLKCTVNNEAAIDLIYEILAWTKTSTNDKVLFTNSLLLEALDLLPCDNRYEQLRNDICLYLAAICKQLIASNHDPSQNLLQIMSILYGQKGLDYSVLLMILADLLQTIAPAHVLEVLRVINLLLDRGCNRLSQLMILDGVVQLLGQPTFVESYLGQCDNILQICLYNTDISAKKDITTYRSVNFHVDLIKYYHFAKWWSHFESEQISCDILIEQLIKNTKFARKNDHILRALFYDDKLSYSAWQKLFDCLVELSRSDEVVGSRIRTPILYALANDTNPQKRLHLLHALTSMGAKDHVLGVLKALSKDIDRSTSLDLYLRLWKAEPRTYPFLYDVIKDNSFRPGREDPWETMLARTYTIREICLIKPQQHGADLVNMFSEILNKPDDTNNEAAVALAIDAIASLCENHVINIVSTWKVLGFKFTHEKRPRIIRSLCKFFTNVASIQANSLEQEKLVNEIIIKLWQFVTDFDDRLVIVAALEALKSFPPGMMNIFQIPDVFRRGINLPADEDDSLDAREIPAECWIQLVQHVNYSAIEEAGDLVATHIRNEMANYRGGVYFNPPGRPEPTNLKHFPNRSILAAVIHRLKNYKHSRSDSENNEVFIYNLLRIVANKYPKPIPPLDWCFLHEYFHDCFEMKKYCLQIAIKQMPHSGTAKRLIENYLNEMIEAEHMDVDDVLVVFESLDVVTESVQTDIYKRFINLGLQFVLERSEDESFKSQNPFGTAIGYLKTAVSRTYENEENYQYLCETLENLFSRFEVDSTIFSDYVEVLSVLPSKYVSSLLKPSSWIDKKNLEKLQKSIYLQFSIHKYNKTEVGTHLLGLTDILRTVSRLDKTNQQVQHYFQRSFLDFVACLDDGRRALTDWIVELMAYIQTDLAAESETQPTKEILFLLDVFMMAVISLSGYGGILEPDTVVGSVAERLALFPPSLEMLFQQNLWREIENKIYEFLYHLYNHSLIPLNYGECLRNALISCKEQSYFQQPKVWPKFVSLRRL